MRKIVWMLAVGLAATAARAQERGAGEPRDPLPPESAEPAAPVDELPLADACVAAIRGELSPERAPPDLAWRCERLLREGAPYDPAPAARTGREPPSAGESIRAAFGEAGRELVGRGPPEGMGARRRGPVTSTLVTNPIGWFSGLGVNAEYSRPLEGFSRLSWVAAARYSRTHASNGEVSAFGLGGGADLFVIGGRNEGLRIGPRLEVAFGSEDIQGRTTFGRVGISGEVGYNFIALNGITASAAGGLGGRLAGDPGNDSFEAFTGGDFGPYLKLGLGYSW